MLLSRMEFREVFKDNSIHKMKVIFGALIFTAHIQILPSSFCAVSIFYLKKLILLSFSGQIGVLHSSRFARSPSHFLECERFEVMDKRHFSNQHFFP